jgi:hypothetical protein
MSNAKYFRSSCFIGLCLASLAGCGGDESNGESGDPSGVTAEVSEDITTVVNVSWTTSSETRGVVEYGPTEELGASTPIEADADTEHRVPLLGLKPETEYFYRVVLEDERASSVSSIVTGRLPSDMPVLTGGDGGGNDLYTLVPMLGATTAVTMLDPDGDIVWYHKDDRALDFYRARLSVDGKSIVYNAGSVSGDPADNSELVRVSLDGSESTSIAVPLLAHDFVEHPDGTFGAIVVEYRDYEGTELRGDKIVEVSPDGTQTTVFSTFDCFDPAVTMHDEVEHGWTFANALDYDPEEDAYYLGMRNFSSIAKIDRQSGECEWVLGTYGALADTCGAEACFTFASGAERFWHQHQFEIRGNRALVFDNDGSTEHESRVLEYELDFDTMVATEVWSYLADPVVFTFVLGEPARLENGDTFVNWSAAGQLERVSASGESLWKVNSEAGSIFAFSTISKSPYGDVSR